MVHLFGQVKEANSKAGRIMSHLSMIDPGYLAVKSDAVVRFGLHFQFHNGSRGNRLSRNDENTFGADVPGDAVEFKVFIPPSDAESF